MEKLKESFLPCVEHRLEGKERLEVKTRAHRVSSVVSKILYLSQEHGEATENILAVSHT